MVWLAIDLGDARVGLAISDPELTLAHPAGNIEVDGDSFHALDEIINKVLNERIEHVVIGLPLQLDGADGKSARKARRWAANLERRLTAALADQVSQSQETPKQRALNQPVLNRTVPIELIDERLTTVAAHRQLHDNLLASKRHRPMIDQQSAVLILQLALDRQRRNEPMHEGVTSG